MVELIRKKLGDDVMIRIDSNQAYSLATARQLARPLEELGVRNWEDPVASIEEMRELRRHTSIPFSTHNIDIARAMELKVPDAFVGNPTAHGGIGRMHALRRRLRACRHRLLVLQRRHRRRQRRLPASVRGTRLDPRAQPVAVSHAADGHHRGRAVFAQEQCRAGAGGPRPRRHAVARTGLPPAIATSSRTGRATNTTIRKSPAPIAGCR